MADFTRYAAASAVQAVEQAGIMHDGGKFFDPLRTGVYLGNGIGGFEITEESLEKLFARGPNAIAPMTIPKMISNEAAGNISIKFGLKGPSSTISTACASGTDAIGAAFHAVKYGIVDAAAAGGTEGAISKLALAGFCRIQALSTAYNDTPELSSRPFDKDRDGFVMGEGAAVLFIEELEHARRRGANILAEIAGYGMTCDASHITAPDPEGAGAARAMSNALESAGMQPEDVDYINAHGTSTPANDPIETVAIKKAFGDHAYTLKVSSTKSMTAHLIGAAGGIEALISVLAIQHQFFPPTINLETPDEGCDLDYVPKQGIPGRIRAVLTDSLGFGGHNGALVIREFKEN
jgi:3-oxoacyl-[acyl-carrier-protein] synthase II